MAFSFGTPATSAGAFGTTGATGFGFGAPTATAPVSSAAGFSFGGGFGAGTTATSQAAPAFGAGFGQAQQPQAAATGFSFGQPQAQQPAAGGLGLFGAPAAAAPASAASGFSFGAPATSAAAPAFGSTFGIGGFGATTTTSAAPFQLGGFGAAAPAGGSLFALPAASAGTTGLSLGLPTAGAPGGSLALPVAGSVAAPQVQQQQLQQLLLAVSQPSVFGDERDALVAKWNALQALWGTGRGYLNQAGQYVDFTRTNPFCAFKAVGYSCVPKFRTEDGLLGLVFAKKLSDFEQQQVALVDALTKMINRPTLSVCVESVNAVTADKTEMVIYVQERAATGATRRLSATESFAFFGQPQVRQQLATQFAVESVVPRIGFTTEQLADYLNNPPPGIDVRIWNQAKLDNPDPEKFIPVPIVGFDELHKRLKNQEQQTQLHQTRLAMIGDELDSIKKAQAASVAKVEEYKRRHLELSHRVLKVIVKQEVYRKLGQAFQPDEEQLRIHFENLQAELNAPTQFKGRLSEIMSQLRLQQHDVGLYDSGCQLDQTSLHTVRQHLKSQQEGIHQLISIIKEDLIDLSIIEQGWQEAELQHKW